MVAAELWGGWVAYASIAALVIFFSVVFVKLYTDRHDSEALPTVVSTLGLIFVLLTVCLVPVDIFLLSSTVDSSTGRRAEWATDELVANLSMTLQIIYYVAYSLMMAFAFLVIPFAYFYFEEFDLGATTRQRACGALKYTVFTALVMLLFWLLGLFLKPNSGDPSDPEWYRDLLSANDAVRACCFVIAMMTIIGALVFITYTAYGMFAMPIHMIKSARASKESAQVDGALAETVSQKNALQARYLGGRTMTPADKRTMEDLERKERLLSRRSSLLDQEENTLLRRCVVWMRPFEIFFGIIFLLLSIFLFVCLLLTAIDKAAHSICGSGCGFVIDNPTIFNPVDSFLVILAAVFPLDYVVLVLLIAYMLFCTIAGIMKMGIRLLWVHLYNIRIRATEPQGLLMMCIMLMMGLMCLNVFIIDLAPAYTAFGYQKYCNATDVEGVSPCQADKSLLVPCSHEGPTTVCTPTAISTIFNTILATQPFFGTVFFAVDWLFLLACLIGSVVAVCKKPSSSSHIRLEDSDDES